MKSVLAIVALAAICAVGFVLDVALLQAMTKQLHMNDFGKFYYSAQAFIGGWNMYAPSPATNVGFVEAPELQLLNMNPPHFHLLVLPLAVLEPDLAVTIWVGVSVMALVVSLIVISRELETVWTPTRVLAATAGSLVFAGTQSFFVTGNLSLLLLLALTVCWASARHGRWTMAALWLGACLSIKPFLLIFAPYLLGVRRFRALLIALATAAASTAAGWLIFGGEAYRSWYRALAQSGDWGWLVMNASTFGLFRRIFDTQPIGTPLLLAPSLVNGWMVAAALVGVVTLLTCVRPGAWRAHPSTCSGRAEDTDRAFALLLVAAQLISPLGWIYYLWLPAGPIAAVALRRARTNGPDQPQRTQRTQRESPVGFDLRVLGVLRGERLFLLNRFLILVAVVGFAWPMPFLLAFRNHAWATLTIASIYFWATLALWVWLVADARQRSRS